MGCGGVLTRSLSRRSSLMYSVLSLARVSEGFGASGNAFMMIMMMMVTMMMIAMMVMVSSSSSSSIQPDMRTVQFIQL